MRVEVLIDFLQRLFPNRLYIDLQRHLDPDEERLNRTLIDLAAALPYSARGHQRRAPRHARRAAVARRAHLHPQQDDARYRRAPAA